MIFIKYNKVIKNTVFFLCQLVHFSMDGKVNFMCQLGWRGVPTCIVKHQSECCYGDLFRCDQHVNQETWTKADYPPQGGQAAANQLAFTAKTVSQR